MKPREPKNDDKALGMDQSITRRDFLNGVALLTTAAATGKSADAHAASSAAPGHNYYPPTLTSMRGSHPGSFESAHALRDGNLPADAADLDEQYELIVVGAGISGFSAAHFFRERTSSSSRILLLDNHDDFGGHAKRNEFHLQGRTYLMNGGTLEIDSPRPYSAVAAGLIETPGIDP